MTLKTPVSKLQFIGSAYEKRLEKLGISTVYDLLTHYPFRYEDYSKSIPVSDCRIGNTVCITVEILAIQTVYTKNRKKITKAVVSDGSAEITAIWFNQPFLSKTLKIGQHINLAGKVDIFSNEKVLTSPDFEIVKDSPPIHTCRLVPIYPETYGISSKWLRSRIAPLLPSIADLDDYIPPAIRKDSDLMDLLDAIRTIHFPNSLADATRARQRLAFDELFLLQLANFIRKNEWKKSKHKKGFTIDPEKTRLFSSNLPFELTNAQNRSIKEINEDLEKNEPMNRLLEGDVGSGKTVVAAEAVFTAYYNGYQSAFMAPTELLAEQHYQTLQQLLSPLGLKVELLTGAKKTKTETKPDLLVGTHALLFSEDKFHSLGLVVVDEQHRFGVEQRALLAQKGNTPHVLTMTATPIPRTLALTIYGDLDLSILDELPKGRHKINTYVVPPVKRSDAYRWIENEIKDSDMNNQVFIICPLIEESESLKSVRAATAEYESLKKVIFPDLEVGLLHGRMKSKEKNDILQQYRDKKISILVATPVVEVGIDIPSATIMVVEAADRFGLSQLHQLRGRVGRGSEKSHCLLFSESTSPKVLERLEAMERENSGLALAEIDLRLRGPGEVFGLKQHGLPNLKVASLLDSELITKTRNAAQKLFTEDPTLSHYPLLSATLNEKISQLAQPN